jgi:hypothetical protein
MEQTTTIAWGPRARTAQQNLVLFLFLTVALGGPTGADEPHNDAAGGAKWTELFDGKSLGKWAIAEKYDFKRHGDVYVKDGRIVLEAGSPGTAVRWTGKFPKTDYEVTLEAMRIDGNDFFCGMTFPVGDQSLTLVVGGWGGRITGLSSIDGEPAVENETCRYVDFQPRHWHRIRVRAAKPRIEVWIDEEKIIDLKTEGRELGILWVVEPCLPFGVATWRTTGAIRRIRVRSLDHPPR